MKASEPATPAPAAAEYSASDIDAIVTDIRHNPHGLSRFGPPDRDDSSEDEWPKVFIVTRVIEYREPGIRAIYVPDAKGGTPPPYDKWKLASIIDTRVDKRIAEKPAVERLIAAQQ